MADCRDCIHHDVCDAHKKLLLKVGEFCELEYIQKVDKWWCKHFAPTADVAPRAEWISVEERIPKNFESVLVLATRLEDDEYDVLVAYHDRGDWEEQHIRRYESPICGKIKYWMPLPEPLKGE